jgi:thioredoxin reductase
MELPNMETHQVIRGVEIVEKFWRELDYLDFTRRLEMVSKVEKRGDTFVVHTDSGDELEAKCVIYATGSRVRHLDVPGETDYIGRGLSYSAVSHAPLFFDKRTMVVGDGDLALRAVAELTQIAAEVHLVSPTGTLQQQPLAQKLAREYGNVVLMDRHRVKAIQGNGFAQEVVLEAPNGRELTLNTDGIFVELGLIPNSEPVADLVALDENGRIIVDMVNRTQCPGLYAAGDVTNVYAEQVLVAVGEGAKAALSAHEYLLKQV